MHRARLHHGQVPPPLLESLSSFTDFPEALFRIEFVQISRVIEIEILWPWPWPGGNPKPA